MSGVFSSMMTGAAVAQMIWMYGAPQSRAAWGWQCASYVSGGSDTPVYLSAGENDSTSCSDGNQLTCLCTGEPCAGTNYSYISNLTCAGAGDDPATNGCFKLHHSYGTAANLQFVAGRGDASLSAACGDAGLIKVFGNADGLATLVTWGALTADEIDNSSAPATAAACQALCASNADCEFFTYNDGNGAGGVYGWFRGLCMLQRALTCSGNEYSLYNSVISGPKVCGTPPPTPPTPAPTTAAPTPEPTTPSPTLAPETADGAERVVVPSVAAVMTAAIAMTL